MFEIESIKGLIAYLRSGVLGSIVSLFTVVFSTHKNTYFKRKFNTRLKDIHLSQKRFNNLETRSGTKNIRPLQRNNIKSLKSLYSYDEENVAKNKPSVKLIGIKKVLFYISSIFIVPIIVILVVAYVFLSSNSLYIVSIRYKFLNVSDSREILLSGDEFTNFKLIKLSDIDSVSASVNTTGEKIVGQKASGFISVFNATAEVKVLKKGTEVTCISPACNGLVYVIESDLNLGPGSSANDLKIVASDIGDNYNIPINAGRFRVANFNANTEIIASNIQPISGGTPKQTLRVISKDDIKAVEDKALLDLKISLLNKIKNNPNNKDKYIFFDESYTVEKIASQTDAEGTESEIVNTNLTAKGTIDVFPIDQIQSLVEEMKSKLAPSGYYLDNKFFNYSLNPIPSDNGKIVLKVQVNGVARIDIDLEKLKNDLKGKSINEANSFISKIPNIEGFNSNYSPTIMPEWLRRVPSDTERIQIKLIAESPD